MISPVSNPQLKLAAEFVENTAQNLFLTGKAGTGKTTFLRNLRNSLYKRTIVVAPTGVAAINAGGVTIHSFFQLNFGPQLPQNLEMGGASAGFQQRDGDRKFVRMSRDKKNIIRSLDLLIIDEISMVRADLLDAVDAVLRRYRRTTKPFGGVQLLMIGDLQQLAPVVKEDEWQMLRSFYDSPFFFSSKAIKEAGFVSIELKHVYRQSDQHFIDLLNKIRENRLDGGALEQLNARYQPQFSPADNEGYITLTTHNAQANSINSKKLQNLKSSPVKFLADVTGDFPEYTYPTEEELVLKEGAQVMFVKNDTSPEKRYYNGKIGKVVEIEDGVVFVQCPGEDMPIAVERDTWKNMKYTVNDESQEIEEDEVGSFTQYPLKLAWAITIHKSQGLTFDKAIIDAQAAFAHGQVYVALSRCRSLEGLVLSSKVSNEGIFSDSSILSFNQHVEANEPDERELEIAKVAYQYELLSELFDFSVLLRRVRYAMKVVGSNESSFLGSPNKSLQQIAVTLQTKLVGVAEKFLSQVSHTGNPTLAIDSDPQLQQRIRKGCGHFIHILENELIPAYELISFETDNKAVKKSIGQATGQFEEGLQVCISGLKSCAEGFSVSKLLEARAKASLEEPVKSKPKGSKIQAEVATADIKYPEVFEQLKQWRHKLATEQGLPHYMILSQKAIASIAHFLPASTSELKTIKGVGGRKIEKYGDDILQITLAYREAKNIDIKMPEPSKRVKKKDQRPTKEISLELFQQGKSPAEIAELRNLTVNTVEGHLAHYVGEGLLEVERFVDEEKIGQIAEYFQGTESLQLSEAKQTLGEAVTYSDLRFVLKYMQHTGQLS